MKATSFFGSLLITLPLTASSSALTIPTVPIGNPGNAADTEIMTDFTTGYGSVSYVYRIGAYEVTAGQYTEFLNAVAKADPNELYAAHMGGPGTGANIQQTGSSPNYSYSVAADWANRPVNYVSFWDAVRFANWLHNGQGGPGSTEDGAYTLGELGVGGSPINAETITRNPGARWWLPSEDEWYKAAYHKNDGVTGNYWDYPTASNTAPINTLPDPGNHANFLDEFGTGNNGYTIGSPYYSTEVGAFANSASPYGTFDQGGNVLEWNETIAFGSLRGQRGGSFGNNSGNLHASYRDGDGSGYSNLNIGFRVASIPEPDDIGDYNHDGFVDAADYVIWRKNDGTEAGYNRWRANFGQTLPPAGAGSLSSGLNSVPEPASIAVALVAMMLAATLQARFPRRRTV